MCTMTNWLALPRSRPQTNRVASSSTSGPRGALGEVGRGAVVARADTRRKDCEDRQRSLMVLGCGLATAGVTPGKTGFRALLRPVHSWSPAPARLEELA